MHILWFLISYCNQICYHTHTHTRWQLFEMLYLARDGVEPNIMLQGLHKTLTFCFRHIESINNGNMQSETRKEKVYYAHSTSCQPHQTLVIVQFLNVARWTGGKISISAWTLHKCSWGMCTKFTSLISVVVRWVCWTTKAMWCDIAYSCWALGSLQSHIDVLVIVVKPWLKEVGMC